MKGKILGLMKKYPFISYLVRWQLSTPILYLCIIALPYSPTIKTIIANLIGGAIFYWFDKFLFSK